MKMKFPFVMNPLAVALSMAFAGNVLAQSNKTQIEQTIEVVGKAESLTQNTFQNAKESVKSIPGGASIVDLNQVREGRQATWSDSLGMAPGVYIQDRFGSEEARLAIRGSGLMSE